VIKQRGRNEV